MEGLENTIESTPDLFFYHLVLGCGTGPAGCPLAPQLLPLASVLDIQSGILVRNKVTG